jgi:hypothetical protein
MLTGIVGAVGEVVEWRPGHLAVRPELAPDLEVGAPSRNSTFQVRW